MTNYFIVSASAYNPVSWDGLSAWTAPKGWTVQSQAEFETWFAALPAVTASYMRQLTDTVLQRLTDTERNSLFTARQTNTSLDYFVTRAAAATAIRSDDPDFPSATSSLDSAGIISSSRWSDLLAP